MIILAGDEVVFEFSNLMSYPKCIPVRAVVNKSELTHLNHFEKLGREAAERFKELMSSEK